MTVFCFVLGLLECALFWWLDQGGRKLAAAAEAAAYAARYRPAGGWPRCALIVPVGGKHPQHGPALLSLLGQEYPDYTVFFVTAKEDDPSAPFLRNLCIEHGAYHVTAGKASQSGQKNRNLLAGVAAAGTGYGVYAFCDSTHIARPDFLRCLIRPIAENKAEFTTGYHQVLPQDQKIVSLAYALCAMFMRFLQGTSNLTQLWGGAMAMEVRAFMRLQVMQLWAHNVVDDCSLSAWLIRNKIPIKLCPAALLTTYASDHAFTVWLAWLERQILFLKFCMHGQWLALCVVSLLLLVPPVWAIWAMFAGILGLGNATAPFLALCWLCLCCWFIGDWRRFLQRPVAPSRWLIAFFCAIVMFAATCAKTLFKQDIIWQNIKYSVGKGGRVKKIEG